MANNKEAITSDVRDRWGRNTIDAIAHIHTHGVIHADINARDFLVAVDLSIKLCDFAGLAIGGLESLWFQKRFGISSRCRFHELAILPWEH